MLFKLASSVNATNAPPPHRTARPHLIKVPNNACDGHGSSARTRADWPRLQDGMECRGAVESVWHNEGGWFLEVAVGGSGDGMYHGACGKEAGIYRLDKQGDVRGKFGLLEIIINSPD